MTAPVAIVVVNYNGERLLPACLDALARQSVAPAEIVVADNGSADGSLALLRREHPGVRVLPLGRNHGFAGGANRGVAATTAEWVCVLNTDAAPAPDWLEQLFADEAPGDVWALGSVLVSPESGRIESAGDQYALDGRAFKLLTGEPLDALPGDPYPVFAAPGAAPVFRRRVFEALGGYEERFFLYYEDVDLAFRALLRGHRALMVPRARVVHELGATSVRRQVRFYVARNSLWCAVRCLPAPKLTTLAHRMAVELRWVRPRAHLAWVLAGRLAGLLGLPWAVRTRRRIQAERRRTPGEVAALLTAQAATVERARR